MGKENHLKTGQLLTALLILLAMSRGTLQTEFDAVPQQTKPLELNIVDMGGTPTLSVNTASKTFGIEFSAGEYKVTAMNIPVLSFDEKLIDSKDLIYAVENPVIFNEYKNVGYDVWKLLHADIDFKNEKKEKKTRCGNIVMLGGLCKLSKVVGC